MWWYGWWLGDSGDSGLFLDTRTKLSLHWFLISIFKFSELYGIFYGQPVALENEFVGQEATHLMQERDGLRAQ